MSEVWNKVYSDNNSFFGEAPSFFALKCFIDISTNNVKKILEIGAGHGRDTIFFASQELDVTALDYSEKGIEILNNIAKELDLTLKARVFDIRNPLPFPDNHFDVVYSHMLLNMRFSMDELLSILSEIKRVLKLNGLNFFSVRSQSDQFCGKGSKVDEGIYDINGFQVKFFSEQEIRELLGDFEVLWMKEKYEEPVTLYLVAARKS